MSKKTITLNNIAVMARAALDATDKLDAAKIAFETAQETYKKRVNEIKDALKQLEALPRIVDVVRAVYPEYVNQRTKDGRAMYQRVDRLLKATGLYEKSAARSRAGKENKVSALENSKENKTNVGKGRAASTRAKSAPSIGATGFMVPPTGSSLYAQSLAKFLQKNWSNENIADLIALLSE